MILLFSFMVPGTPNVGLTVGMGALYVQARFMD